MSWTPPTGHQILPDGPNSSAQDPTGLLWGHGHPARAPWSPGPRLEIPSPGLGGGQLPPPLCRDIGALTSTSWGFRGPHWAVRARLGPRLDLAGYLDMQLAGEGKGSGPRRAPKPPDMTPNPGQDPAKRMLTFGLTYVGVNQPIFRHDPAQPVVNIRSSIYLTISHTQKRGKLMNDKLLNLDLKNYEDYDTSMMLLTTTESRFIGASFRMNFPFPFICVNLE